MTDAFERAAEQAETEYRRQRRTRIDTGQAKGFQIHATVFVAVQLMLVATWALTGGGYLWFLWPLMGWGIGLAAHYAAARDSLRRYGTRERQRERG